MPGLGLVHKLRVGKLAAAQSHKVAYALLQQRLGKIRVLDGVGGDDGDGQSLLESLGHVLFPARGIGEGLAVGIAVPGAAVGDINAVDALGLQMLADGKAAFQIPETRLRGHFIAADAYRDGVVAQLCPDGGDDLVDEAAAVLQRAAVLVGTVIVVLAEELGHQIAMGAVEFHTVIACLFTAHGSRHKLVLHPLDVLQGHLPGHLAAGGHGDAAGAEVLPPGKGRLGGGTAVVQLGEDLGSVLVDGTGEFLSGLDVVVLGHAEVVLGGDGVHIVHAGILIDDEADAALGPLSVVGDEPGGGVAVGVRQVCAHRGHDGPVADGQRADMALLKEFFVCHGSV